MLHVSAQEHCFSVSWKNRVVLSHSPQNPCVTIGEGEGRYRERHGSFKIKNIWVRNRVLRKFEVKEMSLKRFVVVFENTLTMVAESIEDRLELRFTAYERALNRLNLTLCANAEENIYGCGEQFSHLNLKGRKVPIWCEEQGIGRGRDLISLLAEIFYGAAGRWYTTYFPQPSFVSSARYFVHSHGTAYCEFNFKRGKHHQLFFWEIPERITIDSCQSLPQTVSSLSALLGRQPKLPEWAYTGAWLGIQGGIDVVKERLQKTLNAGAPVTAIWAQDWEGVRVTPFGRQLWWNWEADTARYPNLLGTTQELRAKGIRFLGYINPFLATEKNLHAEASAKNLLISKPDGTNAHALVTSFPAAMLDLTNSETRTWIKGIIKTNLIDDGLSGWMADFGEWAPPQGVKLASGANPEHHHNAYPVEWARLNYEAIVEAGKEYENVFFVRAGYSGTSRWAPIVWAGDQLVNWSLDDGLATVIPAALSLGYCGVGVSHSDIGGYTTVAWVKRSKELFQRWAELAAFTPVFRTHEGNRPDANWQFHSDSETLSHFARMAKIHSHIAPYVKVLLNEYQNTGMPLMRHMALHCENDSIAAAQKYQYFYGKDLLVAPVYRRGKKEWKVYVPAGRWVHVWSEREFAEGWHTVPAPIGEPPVFWNAESAFAQLFRTIASA